jgi:hypothetical protein
MSDVTERMQDAARTIQTVLPAGTGFVVLAFDFGQPSGTSQLEYVSNVNRASVGAIMRLCISARSCWYE